VNDRVDDAADAGGSLIGVGLASVEPSDHGIGREGGKKSTCLLFMR
jgi:hypothetical protein